MSDYGIYVHAGADLSFELPDEFKSNKVKNLMEQFFLKNEDVDALKRLFDKEMEEGLEKEKELNLTDISKMTMNVTYFTEFFDGTENGDFVVIHLTVQNLIIVRASIQPGFPVRTIRRYFAIDESIRRVPYIKIFEYLCECLLIFFSENNLLNKPQILGFSTDLPMIQFDINKAIINYFTMTASEFPLNFYDIRKCFETVMHANRFKALKFDLVAIMTHNLALMVHSSYRYGPIDIFLNLESDCDLIYQEDLKKVNKWKSSHSRIKHVLIDTELRHFGESGILNFMATSLDWSVISEPLNLTEVDKECRLQKFLTEKYILELIRFILTYLHHELVYCREGDIGDLYNTNSISLSSILNFMSIKDMNHALQLLPGGTIGVNKEDALIAKYVCKVVFIRVALLVSICLSRIFMRMQKDDFIIAVKSPLLENLLSFETYIRNFMKILVPHKKFQIFAVKDDVCMEGAALATSIINRQRKEMN